MQKNIYFIGIGGIGTSGLARYYKSLGYDVSGSDKFASEITQKLEQEGINVTIGEKEMNISKGIDLVIYSSAIPENQSEFKKAKELGIKTLNYPQALGEVTEDTQLISIAGTHGKSTTTSLISLILKDSGKDFASIVGSILKEFDGTNFYYKNEGKNDLLFVLESCEYKRNFLNYKPFIGVITNIEVDHLDYYKDETDYILAFEQFIENIRVGGYAILNKNDKNSNTLIGKRKDISYIIIDNNSYIIDNNTFELPKIHMKIPGKHILFDAHLAFVVGKILGLENENLIKSLEAYNGIWRRMEKIGTTENGNILMSDYGHHPTEIIKTTQALKEKYIDKKLFVIFQPHQYSRTIELIDGFRDCFEYCDTLIIPNIYESRDSEEDKKRMNGEIFVGKINHPNKYFGNGFERTLNIINDYDTKNPNSSIILLLGAGNIDDLRYKIKTS